MIIKTANNRIRYVPDYRGWSVKSYPRKDYKIENFSLYDIQRFCEEIGNRKKTNEDCWFFKKIKSNYYPTFKGVRAHRVSYTLFKGTIPPYFTVDHLCFNKTCVNPNHLEAVTVSENVLRFSKKKKEALG